MDSTPSSSGSRLSNTSEDKESERRTACRKFLPCWKYLFPWVEEVQGDDENEDKLYCHECQAAGMTNDFVLGKVKP